MAKFVFAPSSDVLPTDVDCRRSLLFFCKQLVTGEQDSLKAKFEAMSQEILRNPVFVLDRNQTFEHKQSRTGSGPHSQCLLEELLHFLPSDLPVSAIKEHAEVLIGAAYRKPAESGYMQYEVQPASGQPQSQLLSGQPQSQLLSGEPQGQLLSGEPQGQHLEACFLHVPSWDKLEVHYFSLHVYLKPKSRFFSRAETLEIDGERSIAKFTMITPTAIQVPALCQQEKDLDDEIEKFYKDMNKYSPKGDASAKESTESSKRSWGAWCTKIFSNIPFIGKKSEESGSSVDPDPLPQENPTGINECSKMEEN